MRRPPTGCRSCWRQPGSGLFRRKRPRLLEEALRRHEPWLEWSGKRERPWFEVDPVALHMHERVSTQAILRVLARQDVHRDLFADPQLDYARAVQFYRHDVDWTNRMILGDSLQVMASLARREDLAGKVQMIYIGPPYGISFKSNFQPQLGQREVKDRERDLTREPEMVKAYRDTWTLGIHSYPAYLRDRLATARELLADTGSIFLQISDENLHRVRCVLDEVFGPHNFCAVISFQKTGSMAGNLLPTTVDYILWYARRIETIKYKQLYLDRRRGDTSLERYDQVRAPNGAARRFSAADEASIHLGELERFRLTSLVSDGVSSTPQVFQYRQKQYVPKVNPIVAKMAGFCSDSGAGVQRCESMTPIVAKMAGFCSDSGAGVQRCESMTQVSFESCVTVH